MTTNKPIKVAIADDHALFRKGIVEILADFPEIQFLYGAANGKELLQKISTSPDQPDVCILDINMPEMNGFETAAAIRKQYPDIKLLALSMYDSEFSIIKMLKSGAHGYVLKDIEPEQLKEAIIKIHTTGYYHSNVITEEVLRSVKENSDQSNISDKEANFLAHACSELTYREIATIMGVSPRTVDGYRDALFEKLNIKSRTGLVIYALKTGIVSLTS